MKICSTQTAIENVYGLSAVWTHAFRKAFKWFCFWTFQ